MLYKVIVWYCIRTKKKSTLYRSSCYSLRNTKLLYWGDGVKVSYRACLSGPKVPHTDNVCHLPLPLVEPGLFPHPSASCGWAEGGSRWGTTKNFQGCPPEGCSAVVLLCRKPSNFPSCDLCWQSRWLGLGGLALDLSWPCLRQPALAARPSSTQGHGWNRGEQPRAQLPRGQAAVSTEGGQQSEVPSQSPGHHESRLPAATASEVTVCDTTCCISQVAIICCSITFGPHQIYMLVVY